MRRSAAPSFKSGGPGKRIKFSSPLLTTTQNTSPTPLPLRELDEAKDLLDSCSDDKENAPVPPTKPCSNTASMPPKSTTTNIRPKFTAPRSRIPASPLLKCSKDNEHISDPISAVTKVSIPVTSNVNYVVQKPKPVFSGPKFAANRTVVPTEQTSGSVQTSQSYFRAMYTKVTKKKHKTWEGDGVIIVGSHSIELRDQDNKSIGKKSQCRPSEISAIKDGSTLFIGGKEVLVEDALSKNVYNSGSCFSNASLSVPPERLTSSSVPKGFKCPNTSSSAPQPAIKQKPRPRHDPSAPNAIVLAKETPTSTAVVLDPYLADKMRQHQIEGIKFLYGCVMGQNTAGSGCVLADDMGLGKTLQCIALVWTLLKQGPLGSPVCSKCLVITPSSLVLNWTKEFKKWLGDERVKVWGLTAGESSVKDFAGSPLYSVMVVSYEMFRKSIGDVLKINWGLIVCDEGHRLKNIAAKIGEALCQLPCKRRVVLTGTPVQNNLKEFYTLASFVNPGVFGNPRAFNNVFAEPIQASLLPTATSSEQTLGKARSEELAKITSQFLLRRTNTINEKYLPPKEEMVLFCKASDALKEAYINVLSQTHLYGISSSGILELICKLKKLCNHPCLLSEEGGEREVKVSDSSKLVVTSSLLRDHVTRGSKVVLVSNYTKTLDILGHLCGSLNLEYHRLDGTTLQAKRQNMVDLFNSTHDRRSVFLLSSKAGGVGLNLIGGNILILYDIDWNPANDLQAMARVWRDGQRKVVQIYRLLTTGTIEEKIFQRQIRKRGLSTCVVDQGDEQCSFSQKDLKDIFSYHFESESTTHALLKCNCEGNYKPSEKCGSASSTEADKITASGDDGEESVKYNHGIMELMSWQHAFHPHENVSFSFIKTSR